jgi:predicted double-glycine peptidase
MEILIKELISHLLALSLALNAASAQVPVSLPTQEAQVLVSAGLSPEANGAIIHSNVPFYSQFQDISLVEWQKLGCGVASLAMVVNYYKPDSASVMALLNQGIASGAYQDGVGWKHRELAALTNDYGLSNQVHDFYKLSNEAAFDKFLELLKDGPVIVSIHNKFDPRATLGHIVVATGYENGYVIYNDPTYGPEKRISLDCFLNGWKRRLIVVRGI